MENYLIANCTDTGKVRSINEDSMATFDSPNGRVVVVCDGMGGQNAGDVASQLAVAVIQDILSDNKFNTPEEAISKSIMAANQAILHRSSQNQDLSGMGATCVMLIISDNKVYYGSVGDSRIYYITRDSIRQITKDQSYVQTLVDAGEISQEAAEHHKDKNQITNALGLDGMTPPVICQMPITPEPGSAFLLCSDGLSGMLNNSMIKQVVSNNSSSLAERAKELVNLANNAGGLDNITVQLVEFPNGAAASAGMVSPVIAQQIRNKEKKNALTYWIVAIVCVLLAIGGVTYWFISKEDPTPKTNVSIKDDTQNEAPVQTQTNSQPSQPSVNTAPAPETKVKMVEKKQNIKNNRKPNNGKNTKIQQLEQKMEQKVMEPEAKNEELNKGMKKVDNSGEK